MIDSDEYFYSLMNPSNQKKNRTCLRCRTTFMSDNAGHRLCGPCTRVAQKASVNARYITV